MSDASYESLQFSAGLFVGLYDSASSQTGKLKPWVKGRFVSEQNADGATTNVGIVGGSTSARIVGDGRDDNWVEAGLGVDFASKNGTVFSAFAEQVLARDDLDYTNIGIRLQRNF